jgi:hypothetical protein
MKKPEISRNMKQYNTFFSLRNTMLLFSVKTRQYIVLFYTAPTEKRSILWTKQRGPSFVVDMFYNKFVGHYVGKGEFYKHACFHQDIRVSLSYIHIFTRYAKGITVLCEQKFIYTHIFYCSLIIVDMFVTKRLSVK